MTVHAGDEVAETFQFQNDQAKRQQYALEITSSDDPTIFGLPEGWSRVEGNGVVASFRGGSLKLVIKPPSTAQESEIDFNVRVVQDGVTVEPPGVCTLTLRVLPSLTPPPAPAPVLPEEPVPVLTPPVFEPQPAPMPPAAEAVVHSAPVHPVAPPPPTVVDPPASPPPSVVFEAAPAFQPEPPRAAPPPAAPASPQPTPVSPPPQAPAPAPELPVQRMEVVQPQETAYIPPWEREPERAEPVDPNEKLLPDPVDGATIELKPGERGRIVFRFANPRQVRQQFTIQDDRALPVEWIELCSQVSVGPNGTGELWARVKPPLRDAHGKPTAPGNYEFTLSTGPITGPLIAHPLTLAVPATPAVMLYEETEAAEAPLPDTRPTAAVTKVGPFAKWADFKLRVANQGNADTSFRIAVKAANPAPGKEDVYDSPQWRYLFDKELSTLQAPNPHIPAPPQPIRLRLQRKGIWWLGWRESHTVKVAAYPVTAPDNSSKGANDLAITAIRWRLLPLPGFLGVPLLLLALALGSGASDLEVRNAAYTQEGEHGKSYVVKESKNLKAQLSWHPSWFRLNRLTAGGAMDFSSLVFGAGREVAGDLKDDEWDKDVSFTAGPVFMFGRSTRREVVYIKVRDPDAHLVPGGDAEWIDRAKGTVRVQVPPDKAGYLWVQVSSGSPDKEVRLRMYPVKLPEKFEYLERPQVEEIQQAGRTIKFARGKAEPGTKDEVVFVTNDADCPVMRVQLELADR